MHQKNKKKEIYIGEGRKKYTNKQQSEEWYARRIKKGMKKIDKAI